MREKNNSLIKFLISLITLFLAAYKLYELLVKLGVIARAQKWTAEQKWYKQAGEYYSNVRKYLDEEELFDFPEEEQPAAVVNEVAGTAELTGRVRSMYRFIQKEGGVTMSSLQKRFKQVTSRTLRRDLDKLERLGYIRQSGKTKSSFYELV